MPSENILNQKKAKVEELSEKFKKAKMIVLTEYRGISVEDDTKLRAQVRADGNEYVVVKNSTIVYALKAAGIEGIDSLEGPTAVVMSKEDYLEPSKVIYKYSKDNEFYQIKGGVIDGKVMTTEEIITLAKLPSRETLLSMLAGALLGNISKVAVALNEVKKQKEEAGEKVTVAVAAEETAPAQEEAKTEAEETPAE